MCALPAPGKHGNLPYVRHRSYQRWHAVLGIIAMLGALISAPVSSTMALAMTAAAAPVQHTAASMPEMPCHGHKAVKKAKTCPSCPEGACPDLAGCLMKCAQPLASPVSHAVLMRDVMRPRLVPMPARVSASSLIPPLLRPPSA